VPPFSSTRLTAHVGLALSVMLALLFASGGFFYLYTFNYDLPPWFTPVRFVHFYVGLASIPFLLGKYGTTGFRLGGYYLRVPRFQAAGPPGPVPRLLSPLLAADFFVLYFSGLYMLFHYYYTVTNIWPFDAKPVQVHLWASIVGAPLVTIHLMWHLAAALRSTSGRAEAAPELSPYGEAPRGRVTRRALLGGMSASGLGLALLFQNTPARSWNLDGLFIGRVPKEERGGPGDFPVETLFGKHSNVDVSTYRLRIDGEVDNPMELSYDDLLGLPAYSYRVRISCVSGWTERPMWRGPRLRDVLALAGERPGTKSVAFHSLSGYGFTWHRRRLDDDRALLVTHVNGAPISENHGFPVRLIVPGYPGQNMVKQIDRIFVRGEAEAFAPDFSIVRAAAGGGPA
jgi:DMSO/TMAO reductase YedYZ molybdopterin-dependent catalytic subunit